MVQYYQLGDRSDGGGYPANMADRESPSWATSPAIRKTMQGCRHRDTEPELALRHAVHRRGLRYRVDARPVAEIRRKADLVFSGSQVAVFLDGCFWHGCDDHYTAPTRNAEFWRAKVTGNVARDRETDRLLTARGWTVVRVWEHEDPERAADRVEQIVKARSRC